jgi:DoxX-like family
MDGRKIGYWFTTGLAAAILTFGAANELLHTSRVVETVAHLGYPAFLPTLLGTWKALAIVSLLSPGFPRLKEWTYAGVVFDVTGALFSHVSVGDGAPHLAPPLVVLCLILTSWALRPASRRMGTLGTSSVSAERAIMADAMMRRA